MARTVEEKRAEFFANVWNHTDDEFQKQFDVRPPLKANEVQALRAVFDAFKEGKSDGDVAKLIKKLVDGEGRDDDTMVVLLQVTGLTRSKIISDLRAMEAALGFKAPSDYCGVTKAGVWPIAGPYLVKRLRTVFGPALSGTVEGLFEALNQATYPGFIRQQRAKTQGHDAERRLAAAFRACGIPFVPADKDTSPMCPDIIVGEPPLDASFDLIVPDIYAPALCVKATVHTSNIGQYGESKDDLEVAHARAALEKLYPGKKPVLIALIDGVGFKSNAAGLNGVLEKADVFCQFKTLWKAVVVAASRMGKKLRIELPDATKAAHAEFLATFKYAANVVPPGTLKKSVEVGEARIETP